MRKIFKNRTGHHTAVAQPAPQRRLFIFDTHPIQYRTPVFREVAKRLPDAEVIFFNDSFNGRKWWFHEYGKIPEQDFKLDLKSGFSNRTLKTSEYKLWDLYRNITQMLKRERPGAVLVYGYYLPEHWMLQMACHSLRIPMLFIGESYMDGGSALRRMVRGPLVHVFFKRVSHFISIGDKTHAFYRQWEIPKERITLAKYCTDYKQFYLERNDAEAARQRVRQELGIPENAFVSLFVGRLFERKRPGDMLSMHQWYRDNENYHTVFVGNGPMEESLKERAKEFKRVHFLGFKDQNQIRDYYYAADVLIVPSEYETWGLVINEAFACGLPAIVTSTCGASGDLVLHGDTGFSYAPGNIPRALSFLDRLVKNPAQAKSMGLQGQKLVQTQYTPALFADAIVRSFRSCLEIKVK